MIGRLAKRRPTTNMLLNKQCALKGVLHEILCDLANMKCLRIYEKPKTQTILGHKNNISWVHMDVLIIYFLNLVNFKGPGEKFLWKKLKG